MQRLAFRNLLQNRSQFIISVGGVALALLLILAVDAIFLGVEGQVTAYIDNAGADIFVSQIGVRNMHMTSSTLPASVVDEVKQIPGVISATPILYATSVVTMGEDPVASYVFGLPPDAQAGRPWHIAEGVSIPKSGEAIVDQGLAAKAGLLIGDPVKILGQTFRIAGLSEDTGSLINTVTFITLDDFARLSGAARSVSYVLVNIKPGESAHAVVTEIEAGISGVTAQTREEFSAQERKIVTDMSTDILSIMNLVALLIGLAIMALTIYTATLARRGEYGVLKALGARNRHLYRVVLVQGLFSVTLGFVLGLALTLLLTVIVPRVTTNLALEVSMASLVKVGGVSAIIAAFSAILPIRQIAGRDPATVFRGGK